MIKKEKIKDAVIQMFKVNMGIRAGEKILILSDTPTRRDWKNKDSAEIEKMHAVTFLGKTVTNIARSAFSEIIVDFYPYHNIGRSGAEPTKTMAAAMKKFNVILAINSFSLTHTQARENASQTGARVATMRGAIPEMFYPAAQ